MIDPEINPQSYKEQLPKKEEITSVEQGVIESANEIKNITSLDELYDILNARGVVSGVAGYDMIVLIISIKEDLVRNPKDIDERLGEDKGWSVGRIPDMYRNKVVELLRKSITAMTEQKEESGEEIVAHNYEMLKWDMKILLHGESIGGNAGSVTIGDKKYSCAAANCYINPENGKIVVFGNSQSIDPLFKRNKVVTTFKVVFTEKGFGRIVDIIIQRDISRKALENMHNSVTMYNVSKN